MSNIKTIVVPDLGGAAEVSVIELLVKVGDTISVDQSLLTLESDKATMDIPASDAGVVKSIAVKVGEHVKQGQALLTLEALSAAASPEPAQPQSTTSAEPAKKEEVKQETLPVTSVDSHESEDEDEDEGDVHAGPGVRKLARELGVSLDSVTPTGRKNRIMPEDLHAHVKARLQQTGGASMPSLPKIDFSVFGSVTEQPLSKIKKLSGGFLQRNWQMIPHVTQFAEADITELEAFRVAQKAEFDRDNLKLTVLVFVMKAVVHALKAFPIFNSSLDAGGESIILKNYYHIGVAVDTKEGLVVPVIRNVDQKSIRELCKELADASDRARRKALTPKDMQGGCFSISSLGGIGGTAFTPIINYPEVAILGLSKTQVKPVYEEGEWLPRLMLPMSLSYDHRVIDGADGARFATYLSRILADIRQLLL